MSQKLQPIRKQDCWVTQQRMPARYLGSVAGLQQMLDLIKCLQCKKFLKINKETYLRIQVNNEPGEKQLLRPDWPAPCRYSAVECIWNWKWKTKQLTIIMYVIQHCFICRPSDASSEDAGIDPGLLRLYMGTVWRTKLILSVTTCHCHWTVKMSGEH